MNISIAFIIGLVISTLHGNVLYKRKARQLYLAYSKLNIDDCRIQAKLDQFTAKLRDIARI